MIAYYLWRLAILLENIVPRRLSYACASVIADAFFLGWRDKRNCAIDNMRHVLRDADEVTVRRVARESFRNYGRYLVDFIRYPKIPAEELGSKVDGIPWAEIDAARTDGKGLIFVAMHFGNWDLGGSVFSSRGYPLNVVVETFAHNKLNELIVESRRAGGMRVIPMERAAFAVVRALRNNESLAILLDRPQAENGVSVRFFDGPVVLPSGPARIALRTGARVMPVAMVRLAGSMDRLLCLINTDFCYEPAGDDEHDVRALTEAILAVQESWIRRYPDQWYMFRRMWSEQPASSAEPALAPEA